MQAIRGLFLYLFKVNPLFSGEAAREPVERLQSQLCGSVLPLQSAISQSVNRRRGTPVRHLRGLVPYDGMT